MFPAAVLICTTLVMNTADGSSVTHDCHAGEPAAMTISTNSFEKLSLRAINDVIVASVVTQSAAVVAHVVAKPLAARRVKLAIHLPRPHAHKDLRRAIVVPTSSTEPKPLSFWDKLKQLPAQAFKPLDIQ